MNVPVRTRREGSKFMSMHASYPLDGALSPEELLSVTLVDMGLVALIELRGDLDMATAHMLTGLTDHVLRTRTVRVLVLDLAQLRFFCADGIRALEHVNRSATDQLAHLVLRDPSPITRKVLTITGMLDTFDIETTPATPHSVAFGRPNNG
jgi:anti-anti-sigma factor